MRAVTIPTLREAFDYYCPICGVDLSEVEYNTFDAEYFCPVCSSQQRASRAPARLG
jgi:uncharacterized Zn finger protein (UPF0148 family)